MGQDLSRSAPIRNFSDVGEETQGLGQLPWCKMQKHPHTRDPFRRFNSKGPRDLAHFITPQRASILHWRGLCPFFVDSLTCFHWAPTRPSCVSSRTTSGLG